MRWEADATCRAPLAVGAVLAAAAGFAPASAAAAPGDPACAPNKTLAVKYAVPENDEAAPLVATHDLHVRADWPDQVLHTSLSVPGGVRVLGRKPRELRLVVPVAATLPVTATWEQARDPSDPSSDASDPATRCVATSTVDLPVIATRPSLAIYNFKDGGGFATFVVTPDRTRGELTPLAVSVRVGKGAHFPSAKTKARRMTVPMLTVDQKTYRKKLPGVLQTTTPVACRIFELVCGRIRTQVSALGQRSAFGWTRKPSISQAGSRLLARTQPRRYAAPYGLIISTFPGLHSPSSFGYDVQVRQSGRLLARYREADRCGKVPNGFGERFYRCQAVRKKTG